MAKKILIVEDDPATSTALRTELEFLGFETEDAMENTRNAVEILGVDWLFFKTDYMKDMFAQIIKSKSKA